MALFYILIRDLIKFVIIKVFHWNIRGKLRNPFLGNFTEIFIRDLIKFEIMCFLLLGFFVGILGAP